MKNNGKPYIIAETAYHHEGDSAFLYSLIDDIARLGFNAVKFHLLLKTDSYITKTHPLYGTIKAWGFSKKQWEGILGYALKKKLDVVALCNDVESLEFINSSKFKISAVELHATGLNDWFLLQEAALFKKTVILGVGGSTIEEIAYAIDVLKKSNKQDIFLMYGFQSYPTDYSNINLSKMLTLKELFGLPLGYADHTAFDDKHNTVVSSMAAMMGINVLEKHYTTQFGKERADYHAAVGQEQIAQIKELMNVALMTYGSGSIEMSKPELAYGNTGPMKKAIVAKRAIKKGQKLSLNNLWFKRTDKESVIKQNQLFQLVGLPAAKNIAKDEIVDFTKVTYAFSKQSVDDFTHIKKGKKKK